MSGNPESAEEYPEGIIVSISDTEGELLETRLVKDDYAIITHGKRYVDGLQDYPGKGTTVLTIKTGTPR